jgi:hypothetical protein
MNSNDTPALVVCSKTKEDTLLDRWNRDCMSGGIKCLEAMIDSVAFPSMV